jgi:putative endonuclease
VTGARTWRRARGDALEQAAAAYLTRAGLSVLARNVNCRYGEIDLILRDGEIVVFAEVRYRASDTFGGAIASVDARKQRKLTAAARWFLQRHPRLAQCPCRFDVLAVSGPPPYAWNWIRDAFQPDT